MNRAVLVMLLAACQATAADYPTRPNGGGTGTITGGTGGGGGGGATDAGVSDGGSDAGVALAGRVCLLSDLRQLTACADKGAGGLKVTLGPTGATNLPSATTSADGRFTIAAPLGTGFTWHVTGTLITPSVMPFSTDNTIPVMGDVSYMDLLESNGGLVQDELHGSVVVRVVRGVSPLSGVAASLSPLADSVTYYDADNNPTVWNTSRTGAAGVVWVPSVPLPGPVNLTLGTIDGKTAVTTAAVERQSITFVTQSIP